VDRSFFAGTMIRLAHERFRSRERGGTSVARSTSPAPCRLCEDPCAGVLSLPAEISLKTFLLIRPVSFVLCQADHARTKQLAERLIQGINSQVEHVIRNGDVNGYPGCINLSFAYVEVRSPTT